MSEASNPDDATTSKQRSSFKTGLIVVVVLGLIVLLGLAIAVWFCIRRKKHSKASESPSAIYISLTTPNQVDRRGPTAILPVIPPSATELWIDPACRTLISQGGYGEVYRGMYKGQSVAIKLQLAVLPNHRRQVSSFLDEAKIMASIEHQRLVPLIGFV